MDRHGGAGRPMIYLDYQATTPLAPEAFEAMVPLLRDQFANPHSKVVYRSERVQTAYMPQLWPEEIMKGDSEIYMVYLLLKWLLRNKYPTESVKKRMYEYESKLKTKNLDLI